MVCGEKDGYNPGHMTAPGTLSKRSTFFSISKHRIDAHSDGVFAIVMTLLVLELKVPELARNIGVGEVAYALRHELPGFFSFVITFILAALFWYLHHLLLNFVTELRPQLVVLNLAFLMFVSLLPFSTGMLGHFLRNPVAQTIYFGNQFAIAFLLFVQWRTARSLEVVNEVDPRETRIFSIRLIALPIAAVAAAVVSWANSNLSVYMFMAVVLISRVYTVRILKLR